MYQKKFVAKPGCAYIDDSDFFNRLLSVYGKNYQQGFTPISSAFFIKNSLAAS